MTPLPTNTGPVQFKDSFTFMAQSLASLAESMPMEQFVSVDRWLSDCIAGSRQSERMIQIPYTDCSTYSVNYRGTSLLVRQP